MAWNATQQLNGSLLRPEWTDAGGTGRILHGLMGVGIHKAREFAADEARWRDPAHPRHGTTPTHDDVVAQFTFGSWSRLLRYPRKPTYTPRQGSLWNQSLRHAFPNAAQDGKGLLEVGGQMEGLRVLRNRVAHHENLLHVNTLARLDSSLALLASIDRDYPNLVMARNALRRLNREDPRRTAS